jgi:hypothetical protein
MKLILQCLRNSMSAKLGTVAAAILLSLLLSLSAFEIHAKSCTGQSASQKVSLVELYTSQGCSSCPPADQWLGTFSQRDDVVPLSMHVAYWDYIGWKDPFAKPEFAQRQRWLAQVSKSNSVYTPGVFVGGAEFREWSSTFMQQRLFARHSSAAAAASIRIEKVPGGLGLWRVAATVDAAHPVENKRLFIAGTKSGLVSKVRAGENNGRTLTNHHVVDFWSGPQNAKSGSQFEWQGSIANEPDELVAFVQDIKTGDVLQAFRLNVKTDQCRADAKTSFKQAPKPSLKPSVSQSLQASLR